MCILFGYKDVHPNIVDKSNNYENECLTIGTLLKQI